MKKQGLLSGLKGLASIARHYYRQHKASIAAMEMVYARQWPDDTMQEGHTSVHLIISPSGSLYRVDQQYYLKGELIREHSWIASYGWHSNGHLMEIGGYRYCIFDPIQRQLYLEYYDDQAGEKKAEIYKAI